MQYNHIKSLSLTTTNCQKNLLIWTLTFGPMNAGSRSRELEVVGLSLSHAALPSHRLFDIIGKLTDSGSRERLTIL